VEEGEITGQDGKPDIREGPVLLFCNTTLMRIKQDPKRTILTSSKGSASQ
jgi:hypothetical protein